MKTKTTSPTAINIYDTLKLSEILGILRSAIRRELLFAEAAGVIACSRIGKSRVLPANQLDSFREWLIRRDVLVDTTAPASA